MIFLQKDSRPLPVVLTMSTLMKNGQAQKLIQLLLINCLLLLTHVDRMVSFTHFVMKAHCSKRKSCSAQEKKFTNPLRRKQNMFSCHYQIRKGFGFAI